MNSLEIDNKLIEWLLAGDVSIEFQTRRDLLGQDRPDLQKRIETEGWGARFLAARGPDGHWGRAYYQPKWTSSHYTLLDLRNLELAPGVPEVDETICRILDQEIGPDGGINSSPDIPQSDVCMNGMALDFLAWFRAPEERLKTVVDFILSQRMDDGGFNCRRNRSGAIHSSVHSTLSVLEGIQTYLAGGYSYRFQDLDEAATKGREFLLIHRLYKSHRTGEVISPLFTRLHYPCRWRFDVLRALDYFRGVGVADPRLSDALEIVRKRRRKDGTWTASKHAGQTHFDMEKTRQPSRWNTLRALRVLKTFDDLRGP